MDALGRSHHHVLLGGMGSSFGPLIGSVVLLVAEEALSRISVYPNLFLTVSPLRCPVRARRHRRAAGEDPP